MAIAFYFRGLIISPDGTESYETTREGDAADAVALGADAAHELRERAGEKVLHAVRRSVRRGGSRHTT